jgi:hypothetical protein
LHREDAKSAKKIAKKTPAVPDQRRGDRLIVFLFFFALFFFALFAPSRWQFLAAAAAVQFPSFSPRFVNDS